MTYEELKKEATERDLSDKILFFANMPYMVIAQIFHIPQHAVRKWSVVLGLILITFGLWNFSQEDIYKVASVSIGIYLFIRGL